ncbi:hypothetical protein PR048_022229 [Dryococelus australis]|uniref:Uncharacterized protein n=1 Tax=Dryococelus australis TaxID=614101 RepID=A0ABQ9H0G1_9NEOP|nr:hypothetical protein PR048_022229 [Dryococelus australis]
MISTCGNPGVTPPGIEPESLTCQIRRDFTSVQLPMEKRRLLKIYSTVESSLVTNNKANFAVMLHSPVYSGASTVCSLAAAPETSQCYSTPDVMARYACFFSNVCYRYRVVLGVSNELTDQKIFFVCDKASIVDTETERIETSGQFLFLLVLFLNYPEFFFRAVLGFRRNKARVTISRQTQYDRPTRPVANQDEAAVCRSASATSAQGETLALRLSPIADTEEKKNMVKCTGDTFWNARQLVGHRAFRAESELFQQNLTASVADRSSLSCETVSRHYLVAAHRIATHRSIVELASGDLICTVQRYGGNTARHARRSDEALGVRVSVARIAPSLLDLGCAAPCRSYAQDMKCFRRNALLRELDLTLAQLSPFAVTADSHCADDIDIFVHKTVESSLQVIELANSPESLLESIFRRRYLPSPTRSEDRSWFSKLCPPLSTPRLPWRRNARRYRRPRLAGSLRASAFLAADTDSEQAIARAAGLQGRDKLTSYKSVPRSRRPITGGALPARRPRTNGVVTKKKKKKKSDGERGRRRMKRVRENSLARDTCSSGLGSRRARKRIISEIVINIRYEGSIPGLATPGFSQVGIVPDDAAGRRAFSGISRFLHPCIPGLLHAHLPSPSSALKTSLLRAVQNPSLAYWRRVFVRRHFRTQLANHNYVTSMGQLYVCDSHSHLKCVTQKLTNEENGSQLKCCEVQLVGNSFREIRVSLPIGPYHTGYYPILYSVHYWPVIDQWRAELILTQSNILYRIKGFTIYHSFNPAAAVAIEGARALRAPIRHGTVSHLRRGEGGKLACYLQPCSPRRLVGSLTSRTVGGGRVAGEALDHSRCRDLVSRQNDSALQRAGDAHHLDMFQGLQHFRYMLFTLHFIVTADNQSAVDIGIFAHKTVDSSLQVIELANLSVL